MCLILSYGDLSIETVFGETALLTAAEKQRWNNCRLLYESQAVLSLRGLNRGSFLFCSLSRDHHTWLVKSFRNVRDLSHVCWCVIRKKLRQCLENISERSCQLPLPTKLKIYVSFSFNNLALVMLKQLRKGFWVGSDEGLTLETSAFESLYGG